MKRLCCTKCESTNLEVYKIEKGFYIVCQDCDWSWGIFTGLMKKPKEKEQ